MRLRLPFTRGNFHGSALGPVITLIWLLAEAGGGARGWSGVAVAGFSQGVAGVRVGEEDEL